MQVSSSERAQRSESRKNGWKNEENNRKALKFSQITFARAAKKASNFSLHNFHTIFSEFFSPCECDFKTENICKCQWRSICFIIYEWLMLMEGGDFFFLLWDAKAQRRDEQFCFRVYCGFSERFCMSSRVSVSSCKRVEMILMSKDDHFYSNL